VYKRQFDVDYDLKLKATTQIKFVNGVPMQADFNLHALYKDLDRLVLFIELVVILV
jgi:hypothetical protein